MGSNPWEVVTPKMGNLGGDFGLVGVPKGGRTPKALRKKKYTVNQVSLRNKIIMRRAKEGVASW